MNRSVMPPTPFQPLRNAARRITQENAIPTSAIAWASLAVMPTRGSPRRPQPPEKPNGAPG